MASLITPDGSVIELQAETLIGRGQQPPGEAAPLIDVGQYEGGLTVSRRHARIRPVGDDWFLRVHPEARNPTLVEDRVVPTGTEVRLDDQSFIRLGNVVLLFRGAVPASPTPQVEPLPAPAAPESSGWAHRLPAGPATAAASHAGALKRVNPFRGLMVDETVWRDAHQYHLQRSRIELLMGHGAGIVEGLEVVAERDGSGLVVHPGLAIDRHGQLVVVPDTVQLGLPAVLDGTLYVRVRYREDYADPQRSWSDVDEYTRIVESAVVDVDQSPPSDGALELARISGAAGAVRDAANPVQPRTGEIDGRFRQRVSVRARPALPVAQLALDSHAEPRHQMGLRFLLREINLSTPYRASWAGVVPVGQPVPPATLLYVAGSDGATPGRDAIPIRHFLEAGGTVLIDACQEGSVDAMVNWARSLAADLELDLRAVGRGHPLLTSRHVFSEPPLAGYGQLELAEGGGLIFSSSDLGCLWSGGPEGSPASRETVRSALELGVNAAMFAMIRQSPLDADLGA